MVDSLNDIRRVIEMDCPDSRRRQHANGSVDMECPFCGGHYKLNYKIIKKGTSEYGVFRCNKCGQSGGTIKFHSLITGLPMDEARIDLCAASGDNRLPAIRVRQRSTDCDPWPVSLQLRDAFFSALLALLPLTERHHADLVRRGFSEEEIQKGNFRSVPQSKDGKGLQLLAKQALINSGLLKHPGFAEKFNAGLIGVPGLAKGGLRRMPKGYFIPIITIDGMISDLMMRCDPLPGNASEAQKDNYSRYLYFSGGNCGCSTSKCENISHYGFDFHSDRTPPVVFLTEGALKGNAAHQLLNYPFITIQGVQNTKQIPNEFEYLKAQGTKKIVIALDMDMYSNVHVKNALLKLEKMADDVFGSTGHCILTWNAGSMQYKNGKPHKCQYNGIDDAALAWKWYGRDPQFSIAANAGMLFR